MEWKMSGRKGCIFSLLVLALVVSGAIIILVQQRRQEAQALSTYHAAILMQAPCLENVCPGYDKGRTSALERLASSEIVQGKEQGTHLIGLLFINSEEEIVGDGVIDFIIDDHG